MKLRISCFLICILFNFTNLEAQAVKKISFSFHPRFGNFDLLPNECYFKFNETDSIKIESLKFYVSGIELLNGTEVIWEERKSFHLLDITDPHSLYVFFETPSDIFFSSIKFSIGIDSITNTSGAFGGDLDPTRGMYWTWQSGYINFKVEGKSNLCKDRNNEFQFHLGGYQFPFTTIQTIVLDPKEKEKIDIAVDIKKLFSEIDFSKTDHIMSPGKEASFLSGKLSHIFELSQQ
jgi:hypothetical protein